MPWPLASGGTREVDEEDWAVVMTAEVLEIEHVAGVTVDDSHSNSIGHHHHHICSISRGSNNISICSHSNHSSLMAPIDFVKDADSSGTSQPDA